MTEVETRVVAAWREAERDLGIGFTSPFVCISGDQERFECLGLVHHFGGRAGMVISVIGEPSSATHVQLDGGYRQSQLAPDYGKYLRQSFIKMLDDWQF